MPIQARGVTRPSSRAFHTRLEPLALRRVPGLFAAAGGVGEVCRWPPVATPRSEEELGKVALGLIHDDKYVPSTRSLYRRSAESLGLQLHA
ncbi:hypothetical protein ACQEVF_03320 [Nonomuraea polychroma]|uniref:hypothetical protein n=1 Tax=Nonomuraea polychroma TaxID=46176 RepID=UPI003D941842